MNYVPHDPLDATARALFRPTGIDGVHGRTQLFEQVVDGLSALISRHREPDMEVLRVPPVMRQRHPAKSAYLNSFPQLLGGVCCLHGADAEIHAAVDRFNTGEDWTGALSPT